MICFCLLFVLSFACFVLFCLLFVIFLSAVCLFFFTYILQRIMSECSTTVGVYFTTGCEKCPDTVMKYDNRDFTEATQDDCMYNECWDLVEKSRCKVQTQTPEDESSASRRDTKTRRCVYEKSACSTKKN